MDLSFILRIIFLGCATGVVIGLMGVGGGFIVVPALVYLAGMSQHVAQGTSLFILLPPIGLGALAVYWKAGMVDLKAGAVCAAGLLVGGLVGGIFAVGIPPHILRPVFGAFLMLAAAALWAQPENASRRGENRA
ncbi:MAG TPA: sulfite exporter TauE/SafE family protein [Candidatus Sulfotelmatobacter sp.]|nr:sulfite exporter TauE/SafE family protein [Candidatus Sulfotelmatobacter sp.]